MDKYQVSVTEVAHHLVTVEADSEEEAIELAKDELGADTFTGISSQDFDATLVEDE